MTSQAFEPDPRWPNPLLELIDRAWWIIAVHGVPSYRPEHVTYYHRGGNYHIAESRSKGTFAIYYRRTNYSLPLVYKMTAEGGPGLTDVGVLYFLEILMCMRREMVLDELAMI